MLKAILFDMDGVLIDSEPIHFESDVNVLKKFNKELEYDFYKKYIGSTMTIIWKSIKKEYQLEPTLEELMHMADEEKEKIISERGYGEIKGAAALVKNIHDHDYLLAVASSSPKDYIDKATTSIKVKSYFTHLVSGAELTNPKPAPDIFLHTAKILGVKPEECLVIEDSMNGVLAAKAAGMVCVGYVNPNSGEQDLGKADYLVEDFESIDYQFLEMVYCHKRQESWQVAQTKNLVIREITLDDLDELYAIYNDEAVSKYVEPLYEKEEEIAFTKAYIQNMYAFYGYGLWVVIHKETGKLIGRMGLSNRNVSGEMQVELGYVLGAAYQKRGYALEACTAIIHFAKTNLDLHKLNIFTKPENTASVNLANKLGFHYKGKVTLDGCEHDWYERLL